MLRQSLRAYGGTPPDQLSHDVSRRYPWYEQGTCWPATPTQLAIHTVSYEGRTIDGLLKHLIRSSIRQLIDVRKNALSRKYGLGGKTTARLCAEVGIAYIRVPALGIPSAMRTDLSSVTAHDRLFDLYETTILSGVLTASIVPTSLQNPPHPSISPTSFNAAAVSTSWPVAVTATSSSMRMPIPCQFSGMGGWPSGTGSRLLR